MAKKKKRKKNPNGIAKWLRSPDGPKHKVIPDKRFIHEAGIVKKEEWDKL